jgi:hypothetical protein
MEEPQATNGIAGLSQQISIASPEQRSHLLATALTYGEVGIDLLIATLKNDPVLTVRATAYQLLQSVDSATATAAIADGILLNPGDRVYGVYKSAVQFDDESYCIDSEFQNLNFIDEINWEELGYIDYEDFCKNKDESYGGGEIENYIPKRVAYYFSRAEAESAAEKIHQKLARNWDFTGSFAEKADFILSEWCQANQIASIGGYGYLYDLIDELKIEANYELLGKLWRDSIGEFSFVCEEIVSELHYFNVDDNILCDSEVI